VQVSYSGAMEPRWLSAEEQQIWRAYLSMQNVVRRATARQLAQDSDMPGAYYEILVHLSEAPDRTMRMSELAAATEGSQSQLSHAVNRLEERGWVQRERCTQDGRGWFAVLTESGFTALAAAAPGHVECVRSVLFDPLTAEEQSMLGQIALRVTAAAEQARVDATGSAAPN
jgi:DNA-binding MarR family transcriptional regulator